MLFHENPIIAYGYNTRDIIRGTTIIHNQLLRMSLKPLQESSCEVGLYKLTIYATKTFKRQKQSCHIKYFNTSAA